MGNWKTIAFNDVSFETLESELTASGRRWNELAHIPATTSLAGAIRDTGAAAIAVATLIDVIVMGGMEGELQVPISEFPSNTQFEKSYLEKKVGDYSSLVSDWQEKVAGRRIWLSMSYQQHLREFLYRGNYSQGLRRVFLESRFDILKSIQTLIAAGIEPGMLSNLSGISEIAANAWVDLEKSYPAVTSVRDELWIDLEEFEACTSRLAKSLRKRIYDALNQVYGPCSGRRTIVYHGFHFFTPPQWAFFQLLNRLDDVEQIFIVHDDGESPTSEVWRWFFVEKWNMPPTEYRKVVGNPGVALQGLHAALRGDLVEESKLAGKVVIEKFSTPIQFVRHWSSNRTLAQASQKKVPRTFAASASDANRFVERFGGMTQLGRTNLALLPIGAYLYGIHSCITLDRGGNLRVCLNSKALVDIVDSGFLQISGDELSTIEKSFILQRVLPFFEGCDLVSEWKERAVALHRLVVAEVSQFGARRTNIDDVARIKNAVANPIRLAPWADITEDEAKTLVRIIDGISEILAQIVKNPKVSFKSHVQFLKSNLLNAMRDLPESERREIEAKISGMDIDLDAEVSAEGLVDAVDILLGRKADFSLTEDGEDSRNSAIMELRSLDEFSFRKVDSEIHLANLADGKFPGRAGGIGWPFNVENIKNSSAIDEIAIEILQTRSRTASLSDLYLFSLGLNGALDGNIVRLSYIATEGGEDANPSPILALMSEPGHRPTGAILTRAGGMKMKSSSDIELSSPVVNFVHPRKNQSKKVELKSAIDQIDVVAASSAIACSRRFALQWAMGPSASFTAEHHHLMLFGNLISILSTRMGVVKARRACSDLWRQFSRGQRSSSEAKAAIRQRSGAYKEWIFTLDGNKSSDDPLSMAYQSASTGAVVDIDYFQYGQKDFLPPVHGEQKKDVCISCPVRNRCLVWKIPED
jgi:hypothetical protein